MIETDKLILVGDNPFHNVSHLSRSRVLQRKSDVLEPVFAAGLVKTALQNGANGFTFTVSDMTLNILRLLSKEKIDVPRYFPLVPNVAEMVRYAGKAGGIPGLAKSTAIDFLPYLNAKLIGYFLKGLIGNKPADLFSSYLCYEYNRISRAAGNNRTGIRSILLHEILTDMAIALEMEWLVRAHFKLAEKAGIVAGFQTQNLPYLTHQLHKWGLDDRDMIIEAPFNATGFLMNPSKEACEEASGLMKNARVIAISVLAAGYISVPEALKYISNMDTLNGVAIGVSNEKQAGDTFQAARTMII